MTRAGYLLAVAIAVVPAAPVAAGDDACRLCTAMPVEGATRALRIEIESGLQFSRLALRGKAEGAALIDPHTGQKRVDANMIDLGGLAYQGRVRVTGEPLRPVRIELPSRVLLRTSEGGQAELSGFVTDLPPVAMLDEQGTLTFNFGARLTSQGAQGGDFRGRVAIRVDYF